MIEYKQVGDSTPKDVLVTTDDKNAELATLIENLEESESMGTQTYQNLTECSMKDGKAVFLIPTDEVGDMADIFWGADNGKLEEMIDQWNQEVIEATDGE